MILRPLTLKPWLVAMALAVMAGSVVLAEYLRPDRYWADKIGTPEFESIMPASFGDWVALPNSNQRVVNPVVEESLKRIYSQTFSRAYIHKPTGRVIMLSIAYGRDQTNDTQLHTPDQCYPSQGFKVHSFTHTDIATKLGTVRAVRLETSMGDRVEPLTYFLRVGEGVARSSKERNLERIRLALQGYLTDGMLFRVSEVTRNPDAFDLQQRFINEALLAVEPSKRRFLTGALGT